jgi:uncharacterized protein YhbP (UPF0306 family)
MDTKITKFLLKHHLLTLATSSDNEPYCCSLFYAFLESHEMLIFMSQDKTKHIQDIKYNNKVAGTIAPETSIAKVQGIQLTGTVEALDGQLLAFAKAAYQKKFPMSKLMEGVIYGIELNYIKMTDNTLGFGKKLIWTKESEAVPVS